MKKHKVFFSSNSISLQESSFKSITATGRPDILLPNSYRGVTLSFSCCERQLHCSHSALRTEAPITYPELPIQWSGLIWKCWWCCFTTWRLRGSPESSSACTVVLAWFRAATSSRAQQECSVTGILLCLCIVAYCTVLEVHMEEVHHASRVLWQLFMLASD